jgi:hypothetical protein
MPVICLVMTGRADEPAYVRRNSWEKWEFLLGAARSVAARDGGGAAWRHDIGVRA